MDRQREGAVIVIRRAANWGSKLWRWQVVLDDVVVGHVRDGDVKKLETAPGAHVLLLRSGKRASNAVHLEVPSTSFVELTATPQEPPGGGGPLWKSRPVLQVERLGPGARAR